MFRRLRPHFLFQVLIVRSCSARRSDKSLMVSIRDRISSASAILDGNTFLFVPSGSRGHDIGKGPGRDTLSRSFFSLDAALSGRHMQEVPTCRRAVARVDAWIGHRNAGRLHLSRGKSPTRWAGFHGHARGL